MFWSRTILSLSLVLVYHLINKSCNGVPIKAHLFTKKILTAFKYSYSDTNLILSVYHLWLETSKADNFLSVDSVLSVFCNHFQSQTFLIRFFTVCILLFCVILNHQFDRASLSSNCPCVWQWYKTSKTLLVRWLHLSRKNCRFLILTESCR
jgi:hypothetical protein